MTCGCGCGVSVRSRFCRGHNAYGRTNPGHWGRRGIPVEKVLPLVRFLLSRYSGRRAAEVLGWHYGSVTKLIYGKAKYISPRRAERLVEVVLQHRAAADPWTWTPTDPKRLPRPDESDARRRHIAATERQFYRNRHAERLSV